MAKGLIEFENQDKYFIKFFLLDATLNLNRWGVTERSLKAGLDTAIGKPFVLTPDFNHPNASDGDDLLIQQEKFLTKHIWVFYLNHKMQVHGNKIKIQI